MPNVSFVVDVTPRRLAGAQKAMERANAEITTRNAALPEGATPEPVFATPQDYTTARLTSMIDSWAKQVDASEEAALIESFKAANAAKRQAALDALK